MIYSLLTTTFHVYVIAIVVPILIGLVSFWFVRRSEERKLDKASKHMTIAVLTAKEVFPHTQLLDFLNRGRGSLENTVHKVLNWLAGKTYQEWFEYFEAKEFQASYKEMPLLFEVLHAFYQGMVLSAQDAAALWHTLPESERQKYKQVALKFTNRDRELSFGAITQSVYDSVLITPNFFRELSIHNRLLDEFVAIILEAVSNKTELIKEVIEEKDIVRTEEQLWKEEEQFYSLLLQQIDKDLNRDYQKEEMNTLKRVQQKLNNEKSDFPR